MPFMLTLLLAALAAVLVSSAAAQTVDPKVTPDFQKRRALVKSSYGQLNEPILKSLPPVGLLGKDQFRSLNATWAQFHRSVASGSVDTLRTVVRNARACKDNALALKAETLMESRARIALAEGAEEKTMGSWVLTVGPKIKPEQLGESAAPFIVPAEQSGRVRFGNAIFVEGEGGFWSLDLGC